MAPITPSSSSSTLIAISLKRLGDLSIPWWGQSAFPARRPGAALARRRRSVSGMAGAQTTRRSRFRWLRYGANQVEFFNTIDP
jgi:hypothetical protein